MMPAMSTLGRFAAGAIAAFGAACATLPSGPALDALPGSRMSAEQFAADDTRCRAAVAERLAGRSAADAANQNIGAATGAVFDGRSGAAAGAVVGLAMGAIAGANASQGAWVHAQQRYDAAYYACMYVRDGAQGAGTRRRCGALSRLVRGDGEQPACNGRAGAAGPAEPAAVALSRCPGRVAERIAGFDDAGSPAGEALVRHRTAAARLRRGGPDRAAGARMPYLAVGAGRSRFRVQDPS